MTMKEISNKQPSIGKQTNTKEDSYIQRYPVTWHAVKYLINM